jgi:hypothetical protein
LRYKQSPEELMAIFGARVHGCRTDEFIWRGHRLIVIENERLRISVVPSKGADIIELRYKPRDLDLLWHSRFPLCPPGEHIPTIPRRDGAFLDFYPGCWQEIFPTAGGPTVYKSSEFGTHGEVALLPWDVRILEDSPKCVELEFSVETFRMPLRLERRLRLLPEVAVLDVRERVSNLGGIRFAYQWGHHIAIGAPFFSAGCTFHVSGSRATVPAYAENLSRRLPLGPVSVDEACRCLGPESRTEDVIVFEQFDSGQATIRNHEMDLQAILRWDPKSFPYLWCWQSYGQVERAPFFGTCYTLGLEPFNCPSESLDSWIASGAARYLGPGEEMHAELQLEIGELR